MQKVRDFTDAVGTTTNVPNMLEVAARARELRHLSNPLNVKLAVMLCTHGMAWAVGFVQ